MYSVFYIHDVMVCIEPVVYLENDPFIQLLVENKLEFSLMLFVRPAF